MVAVLAETPVEVWRLVVEPRQLVVLRQLVALPRLVVLRRLVVQLQPVELQRLAGLQRLAEPPRPVALLVEPSLAARPLVEAQARCSRARAAPTPSTSRPTTPSSRW